MAGVLEHRQRLAAVVHQDLAGRELRPGEVRIGLARGEEEAVPLVDLREVQRGRRLALLERPEALRGRRLRHVHAAVQQTGDRRLARRGDRMRWGEAFLLEEAAGKGGDQRRIEGGETGELDADSSLMTCLSRLYLLVP